MLAGLTVPIPHNTIPTLVLVEFNILAEEEVPTVDELISRTIPGVQASTKLPPPLAPLNTLLQDLSYRHPTTPVSPPDPLILVGTRPHDTLVLTLLTWHPKLTPHLPIQPRSN